MSGESRRSSSPFLGARAVCAVRREVVAAPASTDEPIGDLATIAEASGPEVMDQEPSRDGLDAARDALLVDGLATPSDERLLAELAAGEVPLARQLLDIQKNMAQRLAQLVDHPAQALMLTRVLQQVVGLSTVVTKRVQATLGASANLRAQRRFISLRGGPNEK